MKVMTDILYRFSSPKKLEAFPTARMFFVVNEREDPMLVADADTHQHLVEKILSHNGRKEEPNKLTFEVKFLVDPLTEILRYADLKHSETLHDYLTKMGDGW